MTIKITFLGTSAQIPTAKRNHTAILLTYGGENILVDCGEGTQRQFRKVKINPNKLTKLLITHWHGDHVLGIPGLLQTLAFSSRKKALYIYGPKGTKKFMGEMMRAFVFANRFPIKIEEVDKNGKFIDADEFYIESKKMDHGPPTNAYCFVKKGKIRIDKKKLETSKLPVGPLMQKLKLGKDVLFKGKKYLAKNLTYISEGKKICFVLDTVFNKNISSFAKDSDLLICDASFDDELKVKAKEHKHLTAKQGAEIAKEAKVNCLVLTHISQRYDNKLEKLLAEAKKVFKSSRLVEDFDEVFVN